MKSMIVTSIALATFGLSAAHAEEHGHHNHASLETCLAEANKIRPGDFAKVEYLSVTDEGVNAYEIEVVTAEGTSWEFECDAHHGTIVEIEQEVDSTSHPLFAKKMKVSEEQARATALGLYAGTIDELEYEIEVNGEASYEIDIVDEYGVEWKVEINAATGEIDEVQIERWEIGVEDHE